jgi:hypothetical protein
VGILVDDVVGCGHHMNCFLIDKCDMIDSTKYRVAN